MNLVKLDSVQTMSSREIAELTGSSHDNVLKTIRKLISEGIVFGNETPYVNQQNKQTYSELVMDFRNTMIVVSGYSPELRARIIDRWQELEAKQAPQLPTNYISALEELLASKKAEEALQEQLTLAAPAIEFVNSFVTASSGSMGFREVCKLLSVNEATFRKFLEQQKIVYKLHGSKMPYANHLDAGRFEVKAGVNTSGHAYNAYRFTTKGVEWVAGEFAKWNLRGEV